ncbi:dihydrolipoyl dehydrogenase [Texcoconibacillus texcoconensis]|uniref:Dihydrolipoyl dehydrogenase n=1 Tax=Texcoconibacillus texcoconensis TaxID=1095777 RepID=A0A840QNS7_9BACI|nr:dihydrolipoyl dehydrogenase [Texcoconibacillus texcoconensis]MBB5173046.1 dihydrolipoamide dehydrogenase [Texcoconibacillus texcoconensis]
MANNYDLVILGAGTGGYVAAIRASQRGMSVAIVEEKKLGGTCLHQGCIPSKALLKSAEVYRTVQESESFGVLNDGATLDFTKVQNRKDEIVDRLHKGVQHLMKKGNIDVYEGRGRILGPSIFSPSSGTISVEKPDGGENDMLIPKNVLIATGSRPRRLQGIDIDGQHVLTSDEALQLEQLPASMMIVGGGVIGVEWASMLADFGVDVTLVEYADRLLPQEDEAISKEMARAMKKKKVKIHTGAQVIPESLQKDEATVAVNVDKNGQQKTLTSEKLLLAIGRSGNVEDIGLQNTDIKTDQGYIVTNDVYQTKESHIYAIGDVIGGMQLAHVASHEGIAAVDHMAGEVIHPVKQHVVPRCTYSAPEVASIGLSEQEAHDQGFDVKTGTFPFKAIGKALIEGKTDGFVKLVNDAKTDDLLGVHMIGARVTELIAEASLAQLLDATPWEISEAIHPHPSLSEVMGEAGLQVEGMAIHGS